MISNDRAIRQDIYFKKDNSLTLVFQLRDEQGAVIPLAGISWRLEVHSKRESKLVDVPIPSGYDSATIDLKSLINEFAPTTYHFSVRITKGPDTSAIMEGNLVVVDTDVTSIPFQDRNEVNIQFAEDVLVHLQTQGIYATHAEMTWDIFNL